MAKEIKIIMTDAQQNIDLGDHELANNILVDFCCMNKNEFTLAESAAYHGIPVTWYDLDEVFSLAKQGYFTCEVKCG